MMATVFLFITLKHFYLAHQPLKQKEEEEEIIASKQSNCSLNFSALVMTLPIS